MTREEAIICLKGIKNYGRDTFNEQTDWQGCLDMAIKALEQESALDKIRAEIDELPDLNPDYEMDKTIHVSKWAVFDIIDKCKAECEDKE